jgi:hypothetical protein
MPNYAKLIADCMKRAQFPGSCGCTPCRQYVTGLCNACPVPPAPFGGVKRCVRGSDQLARVAAFAGSLRRHADAYGNDTGTARQVRKLLAFDTSPDSLRNFHRAPLVGTRQNQREFFTTVPGDDIGRTLSRSGNRLCNRAQTVVSTLMPVVIVIVLVGIDIDHNHRHNAAVTGLSLLSPLQRQLAVKMPAIKYACESIPESEPMQFHSLVR